MLSEMRNNQKNTTVNDEMNEEYLFQYTESGEQIFNNDTFTDDHLERSNQLQDFNNEDNFSFNQPCLNNSELALNNNNYHQQYSLNNYNNKQIQNENCEAQSYNDYYNCFVQQQQQQVYFCDDFCQDIEQEEQENAVNYANNFQNGQNLHQNQSYIQKSYYQQLNNSFSNKQSNKSNKQSQGYIHENFMVISKNNQKPTIQALHEELNGMQVKLDQNFASSNQQEHLFALPSPSTNIRNNNQKQKRSKSNNKKQSLSIQDPEIYSTAAAHIEAPQSNYYLIHKQQNQQLQQQQQQSTFSNHKVEQTFEQVIQASSIPVSRDYYKIFQEYQSQIEQQQQQQQQQQQINTSPIQQEEVKQITWQNQSQKCEDLQLLKQEDEDSGSTHANSNNKEQFSEQEEELDEAQCKESIISEIENYSPDLSLDAKQALIKSSNKKNVVKNIMSAFKNFILEPTLHNYNLSHLEIVLEMYNKTKKGIDDMSEMQAKFKRYITSKNFNHYTVKLLIQHQNYSDVFKYFLSGPIDEWVFASKVADTKSHKVMIDFLKDCFDDIKLIDLLKRHEKKRAHYQ